MLCVGPIDDKVGRKAVIWFSSLGAALCTLLKPHVDLFCTRVIVGFVLMFVLPLFPMLAIFLPRTKRFDRVGQISLSPNDCRVGELTVATACGSRA